MLVKQNREIAFRLTRSLKSFKIPLNLRRRIRNYAPFQHAEDSEDADGAGIVFALFNRFGRLPKSFHPGTSALAFTDAGL
jgi:hypothetical protein